MQSRIRGKRELGKRTYTRKKNSIRKLAIAALKVEEYIVSNPIFRLAEAKKGKEKPLK